MLPESAGSDPFPKLLVNSMTGTRDSTVPCATDKAYLPSAGAPCFGFCLALIQAVLPGALIHTISRAWSRDGCEMMLCISIGATKRDDALYIHWGDQEGWGTPCVGGEEPDPEWLSTVKHPLSLLQQAFPYGQQNQPVLPVEEWSRAAWQV